RCKQLHAPAPRAADGPSAPGGRPVLGRVRPMTAPRIPSPADPDARVLFLTREGCHLCDDALLVVRAEADRAGTAVEVRDIDADGPVIIVDGGVHAKYRVEAVQLRAALGRRPWWRRLTGRA